MKFHLNLRFVLFLSFIVFILKIITIKTNSESYSSQEQFENTLSSEEQQSPEDIYEPDKTLERIRESIYEIAGNLVKKDNLYQKRIKVGNLPDGFPVEIQKKASLLHQNKALWQKTMLYPTSVWRSCVFPDYKINYVNFCKQKLAISKTRIKLNACLNNFCIVCCDHIQLRYRNIANKHELAHMLRLSGEGFSNIKTAVSQEEINTCRNACKKQYKIDMPVVLPTPPRDPMLGKETSNPAISCMDVKRWGDENAKSGEYWIELSSKGLQKVYCDMETDNGGWTLFYNYKHMPSAELTLISSRLPSNLNENSHMNLNNAGFSNRDVKEIRFFCTEKFNKEKLYWHFKTTNDNIIQVGLNGNQENLRSDSLNEGYIELPPPYQINGIFKKRVFRNMLDEVDKVGIDPKGAFINTPFGISKYEAYWTIKGNSEVNPKYECGTMHDYLGGYANSELAPNMAETHHTIWFRGEPPEKEVVQNRLLGRIMK